MPAWRGVALRGSCPAAGAADSTGPRAGSFVLHRVLMARDSACRYWTTERPRATLSDYEAIRRSCRERGRLFEDPEFPPGNRALYHHKKPPLQPIVWMRPHEMCQRPRFLAEDGGPGAGPGPGGGGGGGPGAGPGGGAGSGPRFDVELGELGDPWLLAAVSSLTLTPRFLERVVPPDQGFDNAHYAGIFSTAPDLVQGVSTHWQAPALGPVPVQYSTGRAFGAAQRGEDFAVSEISGSSSFLSFPTAGRRTGPLSVPPLLTADMDMPPYITVAPRPASTGRFRFWHFGEWVDVLIDDRLPTHKGRLVYMHSSNSTEFWAALLEKAYAKWYGCYEGLQCGMTTRALQDLTGGIVQSFGLSSQDRYLTFQVLNSAVPRSSLLIACIQPKESKRQLRLRNGLLTQHAYSVTGLARVRGPLGETPLVRLRNPWARGEWTGAWSERSWEWDGLSERDKELLSVRVRNDGEFWMSFDDFARHFTHLDLVHVGPDDWMSEPALHSKQPWRAVLARRRWRAGYNAGGGPAYTETTAMNPQFHIQIPRSASNKCHVVVSVTQFYEPTPAVQDNKKKKRLFAIGFAVYEVPHAMTRLSPQFVMEQRPLDVTNHSVAREVATFLHAAARGLHRGAADGPAGTGGQVPPQDADGRALQHLGGERRQHGLQKHIRRIFRGTHHAGKQAPYPDGRSLIGKLLVKYPPEVDVALLQKILKSHWRAYLAEKPSLELCKSLIMLRDYNISGRISLGDIPVLMHMLHFWKLAFQKFEQHSTRTSSYNLRPLLWEAGSTVSNKVLECLVLRFARRQLISAEGFVMAMVRLHLAHERYHSLDTKMKGNPLSLEEMILMTIYS
ncbi:Calpain-1 catalytic subunit [Frankliniella fusca]|uniref:Calpain-1 catalytic subunit n=1 Tax=Frankliniella fusca TaxID=407009 RepID=A0AAE1HNM4_9NEOP|nr:Calpain-1 catalytic subunit [Frankliniella fusca]